MNGREGRQRRPLTAAAAATAPTAPLSAWRMADLRGAIPSPFHPSTLALPQPHIHLTSTPPTSPLSSPSSLPLPFCLPSPPMSSGAEEPSDDASAPTRRLANLDLSETKGDAAHYDDDNTTYHHQLYTGPIIDPHVHFFCFERISYPWLKGPNQVTHPPHSATAGGYAAAERVGSA